MDVTRDDHVEHAINYVIDNLPAGEQGKDNLIGCHFRSRVETLRCISVGFKCFQTIKDEFAECYFIAGFGC